MQKKNSITPKCRISTCQIKKHIILRNLFFLSVQYSFLLRREVLSVPNFNRQSEAAKNFFFYQWTFTVYLLHLYFDIAV